MEEDVLAVDNDGESRSDPVRRRIRFLSLPINISGFILSLMFVEIFIVEIPNNHNLCYAIGYVANI